MLIKDLSSQELTARLKSTGILLPNGPFNVLLGTNLPELVSPLQTLYADYPLLADSEFVDFSVRVDAAGLFRFFKRNKAAYCIDGVPAARVFLRDLALPMFEWGVNWGTFTRPQHLFLLHAAVLEKNGAALILAGASGAGKSTLCAALSLRGWRLFSDELAMMRPGTIDLIPVPRPISLKEQSIEIIKAFAPAAVFGPAIDGTKKGRVAHLRPTAESVQRAKEQARPKLLIFPAYEAQRATELLPESKGVALMKLAADAFNYNSHGEQAFTTLADLVENCQCFTLHYHRLDEAISLLNDVHGAVH